MQNRRTLLKLSAASLAGLAVGSTQTVSAQETPIAGSATRWAEQLGWKVGCQAYSFNHFTFEEAVKKNVQAGCRYIEAFPGQKLTADGGNVGPGMSKDDKKKFRSILVENGCVCIAFGVAGATRDTFEFCSEMGIGVINAEPEFEKLKEVDKLCEEYDLRVGLHNHPQPSRYWDFQIVLKNIADVSHRIGACADTGHYMRSGIKPLDALRALKGRIISFHFKDLNDFGKDNTHDVPWGTGKADVPALLKEIADQKFRGGFSAEYEYNWDNSVPEITESVKFFDQTAKAIALGE